MWEGVRCVGRSEVCRRGGAVWEGWKCVEGVRCVGGVEVCGRGGGMWWDGGGKGVMGGVEVCGRGEVCVCVCGRGGGVWKE